LSIESTANHASSASTSSTVERDALYEKFREIITVNSALNRTLVSYQGNKKNPFYSWFKYKEGFSEALILSILKQFKPGILLDPFSGTGASLFAARELGWQAKGIELLPVGIYVTRARLIAERVERQAFKKAAETLLQIHFTDHYDPMYALRHIAITKGAFPEEEERQLTGYVSYCHQRIDDPDVRTLLLFAAFCILEEISYTRKDGQYLRWDARSGRSQGNVPFNKGRILTFREAIKAKLESMIADFEGRYVQPTLFAEPVAPRSLPQDEPELFQGSCLEILSRIEPNSIDMVLTSPPYANRYDYTRTYALELVYLGYNEEQVKYLRQEMLSCTVENKDKKERLESYYALMNREIELDVINTVFQRQKALQEVLTTLDAYQADKRLNNSGIVSLVRYYFYEMCFVIYELARVLKPGGTVIMVNDNVRYAGEEVPVDLILSDIAESSGFTVKHIWTLPRGKGNSSQQMGKHGRTELRKCIYVWEK
jgi:DNA modification methylase